MSIIKPSTINQLKEIYSEIFLSNTAAVTKIAPGSTLNANAFGNAKLAQKALKDLAVQESQIFPESASGTLLDDLALRIGVPARFTELGGSTYLLLWGTVGTTYLAATHTFTGNHGIIFELSDGNYVIPAQGFGYARVQATTQGIATNVDPNTISQILPSDPAGHEYVTNEYVAMGGQDDEIDDLFRRRIRESVNILAMGTLAKYEQACIYSNNRVLRLYEGGVNNEGKFIIFVAAVDGGTFTSNEFDAILLDLNPFLSIQDKTTGIDFQNFTYVSVDVSLRVELLNNFTSSDVRKDMQVRMQRSLDYRRWIPGSTIEWDDLLVIAKRTRGVKVLLDEFFVPSADISTAFNELPRIRSFSLYDLDGVLLNASTGDTPSDFPNQSDYILQQTLIA